MAAEVSAGTDTGEVNVAEAGAYDVVRTSAGDATEVFGADAVNVGADVETGGTGTSAAEFSAGVLVAEHITEFNSDHVIDCRCTF